MRSAPSRGWTADAVEIVPIKTTGDKVQDRALAEIGGKALWTKELDRALLDGEIDCAVHSMKDVETIRPAAIRIAAMLPRADVRDRLIGADSIAALRQGAVVGTSSPRRSAQPEGSGRTRRPCCSAAMSTRASPKLAAGEVDATLLAAAGLDRLGRSEIGTAIPNDVMLPAPAQGAVGIEARAEDERVLRMAGRRSTIPTRTAVSWWSARCSPPFRRIAIRRWRHWSRSSGDRMTIRAELLAEDGSARCPGRDDGSGGRHDHGRPTRPGPARAGAAGSAAVVRGDDARRRGAAPGTGQCRDRRADRGAGPARDPVAPVRDPPARLDGCPTPPRSTPCC